jgi:uncharacterized membrane protein YcaP (DUF421 family)
MEPMFFDDWTGVARTIVVGTLAYLTMLILLRISGKRTLSKMNAFDFVVTVALGSALANVLLDESVALTEGAVAFGLLIALQYLVTWTSVRVRWVRAVVTGEPRLVARRGRLLDGELRRARVHPDEVRAAVRSEGFVWMDDVEAVILETDGSFSVVGRSEGSGASSLEGVRGGGQGGAPSSPPPG